MAFTTYPTTWVPGYTANSTSHTLTIPLTHANGAAWAATDITDVEANATTGDIRKVYQGLSEFMYQNYANRMMTQANTADRPAKLTISKSVSVDPAANTTTLYYTMTFVCATATVDVANE